MNKKLFISILLIILVVLAGCSQSGITKEQIEQETKDNGVSKVGTIKFAEGVTPSPVFKERGLR